MLRGRLTPAARRVPSVSGSDVHAKCMVLRRGYTRSTCAIFTMPREKPSLKARALRYLSAREHSRQELARKLAPYAEEGDDIEAVLDWLQSQKFLSDERFAESLVHRRAARYGSVRIMSELQRHGLDDTTVASLKTDLLAGENERAWHVWSRKFGKPAENAAGLAKQIRFLQQRGFSHAAVQAVLRRAKQPDADIGE